MRTAVELLKYLITLKCVNDPENNIKPSKQCVEGIKEILLDKKLDPDHIEDEGYHSFIYTLGSGKPIILMTAHFDVVPPGPSWTRDPFLGIEENGRIYGRGAIDDLSNVAVMIYISKEIERIASRLGGTIIVAFTGDEETGGAHGAGKLREYLMTKNLFPSYMINGDGGGLVVINRRRTSFRIEISIESKRRLVHGIKMNKRYILESKYRHAAYFTPGSDVHPLIKLAQEIDSEDYYVSKISGAFVKSNVLPEYVEAEVVKETDESKEVHEVDKNLTKLIKTLLPLTRILIMPEYPSMYGVTATPNVYRFSGDKHIIEIDVRAPVKKEGYKNLREYISMILEEYLPEASYTIHSGVGYLDTPKSSRIVKKAIKVLKELGLKPEVVERAGASDSRYFSPFGVEAIDFGPVGGNAHGPDEYVEIWSLEPLAKFYKKLVQELLTPDEKGFSE